jgi:hypothetical protein
MTELPALFDKSGKFLDADETLLDEIHRAALGDIRRAAALDQAISEKITAAQAEVKGVLDQIAEREKIQRALPKPSFLDEWKNMKAQRAKDLGRV